MIEVIQKVLQRWDLFFFGQKPILFYPAIQSLQLRLKQVSKETKFYKFLEKQYLNIPLINYPSVPVFLKSNFELLHSSIVFDDRAMTLEK